jgi:hypothetical protein
MAVHPNRPYADVFKRREHVLGFIDRDLRL